ncbi:hypothetical protein PQX77_006297 [Marasmius sp. AFHP31]|nr:hypothetical protein PQX77_006297 [Marasmius sp. AFHP31]
MPQAQLWCIDVSGLPTKVARRVFSVDFEPTHDFEALSKAISARLRHDPSSEIVALDVWKLNPSIARSDDRFKFEDENSEITTTYTDLMEHVVTITADSGSLGEIYLDLPEDESLHLIISLKDQPTAVGTIGMICSELLDIQMQEKREDTREWQESLGSEDFERREDVAAKRRAGQDPFAEIPIAILHPAFDRFLLDWNSPVLDIPSELYPLAVKFSSICWNVLASDEVDQEHKKKAISSLVEKLLNCELMKRTKEGAAFDGLLRVDDVYPSLLFLSEDDIGPRLMARCQKVYLKCIRLASLDNVRKLISLPCFMLVISGSHVAVLGCANASRWPTLEYLTGFQVCTSMPSDPRAVFESIARLFACLRRAIAVLFEYYHDLTSLLPHLPKRFLPIRNTFVTPGGQISRIEYSNLLMMGNNIWSGKLIDENNSHGVPVVVKFARHYSVESHRLLESVGVAPKLYYWDLEQNPIVGEDEPGLFYWRMIVMEHLTDAVTLYDFSGTSVDARKISEHLRRAVSTLHANDHVFGDLRPSNIMVDVREEEGHERKIRVALVDFDWAGKVGKARYPPGISLGGAIKWPEGVKPKGLITKEHDLYWLRTWLECMT